MIEKEATAEVEEVVFDAEISWEEFFNTEVNPRVYVGFAITVSLAMAMELSIYDLDGEVAETLFLFHPMSRETILRNISKLNEEEPNQSPIIELSGIPFTDFLFRWSTSQYQQLSPQQQ